MAKGKEKEEKKNDLWLRECKRGWVFPHLTMNYLFMLEPLAIIVAIIKQIKVCLVFWRLNLRIFILLKGWTGSCCSLKGTLVNNVWWIWWLTPQNYRLTPKFILNWASFANYVTQKMIFSSPSPVVTNFLNKKMSCLDYHKFFYPPLP